MFRIALGIYVLALLFLIAYYGDKDKSNSFADKAFVFACFIVPTAILACLFMANI